MSFNMSVHIQHEDIHLPCLSHTALKTDKDRVGQRREHCVAFNEDEQRGKTGALGRRQTG